MEEIRYEEPYLEETSKIKEFILQNDVHHVAITMPAIGMQEKCNKESLELVSLCLKNDEEWIRRAGYICLYHFYIRYREKMCSDEVINFWNQGLTDNSKVVLSMVYDTLDELEEFSPHIYKKIIMKN